jgi:hypothetical protein
MKMPQYYIGHNLEFPVRSLPVAGERLQWGVEAAAEGARSDDVISGTLTNGSMAVADAANYVRKRPDAERFAEFLDHARRGADLLFHAGVVRAHMPYSSWGIQDVHAAALLARQELQRAVDAWELTVV